MKLTKQEKASLVLAMEYMVRNINNEDFIDGWLMAGVADGDIEYGECDADAVDEYYTDDGNFKELVGCFTRRIKLANQDGGLFDGSFI